MTYPTSYGDPHPAVTISSYCKANACVGVRAEGQEIVIVDTKHVGPTLRLTHSEWAEFTSLVKQDELAVL